MSSLSFWLQQPLIWVGAAFVLCLFATWLFRGRRLRKLEAELSEQKSMYEFCLAETGRLRHEISRLRSEQPNGSKSYFVPPIGDGENGDVDRNDPADPDELQDESFDDLTRIKGIGRRTKELLNWMGIFGYSQLAELTREDIEWLEKQLRFKGRIDRENWVEQARALAAAERAGTSAQESSERTFGIFPSEM